MSLPSQADIDVHNSLDEATAVEHFFDKTLEEAEALFRENSAYYQEDLMWMGPKAFQFYLQAVLNYLESDDAAGDSDIANALSNIIEFRATEEGFAPAIETVRTLIDYVIDNYKKFEVDEDIYSDLFEKYRQLQHQLQTTT